MFLPFHRTILCLTASFSVISSGMGLGYPSISTNQLLEIFSPSEVSWFASVTAITMIIGGLFSGYFCDLIGRKATLIVTDLIAIVSFLLIGFAGEKFLFPQLIIARILIGFHVGIATTAAVMYTAETCSPEVRGRLSMLSSPFFTAFGMVVIYLLGALFVENHQIASLYAAGVSLLTLVLCFLIPESPVYYVNKNQDENVKKSLARIFSVSPSDAQVTSELLKLKSNQSSTSRWQFSEFKRPQLYKPFIMMLIFFTIQQFSGIFVVFVFAAQFSMEVGVAIDPLLSAVIIGVTRMLTVLVFAILSDKAGRKPLSLISCIGMFLGMVGLVFCGLYEDQLKNSSIFWLPTAFMNFFIFTGTFGVLALPFAMLGEIYPQKSRGLAAGLTVGYANLISFLNIKTFVLVFEIFGSTIVFGFYAIVAFLGIFFSLFILVETKGKTLLEIEEYFEGKKKEEIVKN